MLATRRPVPSVLRRLVLLALFVLPLVPMASAEEAPAPTPPPVPGPGPLPPAPGGGVPPGPRVNREAMWPAPTAQDWAKPCLLTWQRTWDDAVAVARETNRPILVCINMDGEIASEHYAGVRYRSPEIAALYEPYVTVIASVYRHNPRDYDDEGRRIPCPRFGGVTCGEHIWIEPVVFEKFCDGQRVAPRHIMVELDETGATKESYDVFYRNDTASVFEDVRRGIAERTAVPKTIVRGDRPVVERVASREVSDRAATEAAYAKGDPAARKALLEAAGQHLDAAPLDLLRLAVFGLDPEMAGLARAALAKTSSPEATDLLVDALKAPLGESDREALLGALARLGETSPKARWLAVVLRGVSGGAATLDASAWAKASGSGSYPAPTLDLPSLEALRESRGAALRAREQDPLARIELAEASLALAREASASTAADPQQARLLARHMYADARVAALEAERLGAPAWRVNTILALAAYYTSDLPEAYARAERAVKDLPPGEPSWNTMAVVTIFAEARWKEITQAARERRPWPPERLADVHAAYAILQRHPLGTDGQVVWHYDFLVWLGAEDRATKVLEDGLGRFPASVPLHERYRERILARRGPEALEAAYASLVGAEAVSPDLLEQAGRASAAVGDLHRRRRRLDEATAAYARAVALYERAVLAAPARRAAFDEAIALALASRARIAYEAGEDERALTEVLASFARKPDAAGTRDGVGITPVETAQMLLARLREAKRLDEAARLEAALAALDPALLVPDRE